MKYIIPFGGLRTHNQNVPEFVENLKKRLDKIMGVYFVINDLRYDNSGVPAEKQFIKVMELLESIKDVNIEKFICFNSPRPELDPREIAYVDAYGPLLNDYVTGSTVANLYVAEHISKKFPEWKIDISTNAMVYNPAAVRYWKRNIPNLYSINIPKEYIRNIDGIDLYKNMGLKLKIILNEICVYGCPFRKVCRGLDGKRFCCNHFKSSNILRSIWIPPSEFQNNLKDKIDIAKICHRRYTTKQVFDIMDMYESGNDNYNLLDLIPRIADILPYPKNLYIPINKIPKKVYSCKCLECKPIGNCEICEKFMMKTLKDNFNERRISEKEFEFLKNNI